MKLSQIFAGLSLVTLTSACYTTHYDLGLTPSGTIEKADWPAHYDGDSGWTVSVGGSVTNKPVEINRHCSGGKVAKIITENYAQIQIFCAGNGSTPSSDAKPAAAPVKKAVPAKAKK